MNNNYHTQLDKQNNMLNEIAANNQLLQQQAQQMANFQGTPIRSGSGTQQVTQSVQNMLPTSQMTQQQMAYAQQLHNTQQTMNQMYPNQMQQIPQMNQNQMFQRENYQSIQDKINTQTVPIDDTDEIELSESKPEPKQKIANIQPQNQQLQNQNIDTQSKLPDPTNNMANHSINSKSIPVKPISVKPIFVPMPVPQNNTIEYLVIPLFLIIIFIALVHPTTSKYLNKYLPPMRDMKGFFVRGLILAIAYIAIKFATTMIKS